MSTQLAGSRKRLTARGVKTMLTKAGVDYSSLEITDDPTRWTDLETGRESTWVVIAGPDHARRTAAGVLFVAGLWCAPYSDRDEGSR